MTSEVSRYRGAFPPGHCERALRKTELPLRNLQKRWCGVPKDEPTQPPMGIPGISIYDQDYGYCNGIPHNTWSSAFQQCRTNGWDDMPPFRTADGPLATVSKRPLDMRYANSEYVDKYRDPRKPPVWRHQMCLDFEKDFRSGDELLFQMPHEIECNKYRTQKPREKTDEEKQKEFERKHGYLAKNEDAFERVFPCLAGQMQDSPAVRTDWRWPATCQQGEDMMAERRHNCCRVQLNDKCVKQKGPDFTRKVLGMNWVKRTTQQGLTTSEDYGAVKPWHREGMDPNPCLYGYPHLRE